MAFGATQGLITHLKLQGTPVQASWFPTRLSRWTLPIYVVGGAAAGYVAGV